VDRYRCLTAAATCGLISSRCRGPVVYLSEQSRQVQLSVRHHATGRRRDLFIFGGDGSSGALLNQIPLRGKPGGVIALGPATLEAITDDGISKVDFMNQNDTKIHCKVQVGHGPAGIATFAAATPVFIKYPGDWPRGVTLLCALESNSDPNCR
jgi:hypothetical protein